MVEAKARLRVRRRSSKDEKDYQITPMINLLAFLPKEYCINFAINAFMHSSCADSYIHEYMCVYHKLYHYLERRRSRIEKKVGLVRQLLPLVQYAIEIIE